MGTGHSLALPAEKLNCNMDKTNADHQMAALAVTCTGRQYTLSQEYRMVLFSTTGNASAAGTMLVWTFSFLTTSLHITRACPAWAFFKHSLDKCDKTRWCTCDASRLSGRCGCFQAGHMLLQQPFQPVRLGLNLVVLCPYLFSRLFPCDNL